MSPTPKDPAAQHCDDQAAHDRALARARETMPANEETARLAELFKALGDATRTRILAALATGELCPCALAELLGISISAVSHQLRLLRTARLVRARRQGRNVYYTLDDDHVTRLLAQGLEHVRHG